MAPENVGNTNIWKLLLSKVNELKNKLKHQMIRQ